MWPPCRCQNHSSRRLETTKAKNAEEKKLENGVRAGTRGHRLWGDSSAPPAHLQAPCPALGGTPTGGTAGAELAEPDPCPGTPSFPQPPPIPRSPLSLQTLRTPLGTPPDPWSPPGNPQHPLGRRGNAGCGTGPLCAAPRGRQGEPGPARGCPGGGLGRAWGGAGGRTGVSTGGTYTCEGHRVCTGVICATVHGEMQGGVWGVQPGSWGLGRSYQGKKGSL